MLAVILAHPIITNIIQLMNLSHSYNVKYNADNYTSDNDIIKKKIK